MPGKSDFFLGNDPTKWRRGAPQYERVAYRGVYPGIDAVFYGHVTDLEYDLNVAPGAEPRTIRLRFAGATLHLERNGDLTIDSAAGRMTQHKPHSYQMRDGKRVEVESGYVLLGRDRAAVRVGKYDRGRVLTIDPVLTFSSLVASYDSGASSLTDSIAVDASGNVYVAGTFTWPTNGPPSTRLGSATGSNISIVELDSTGKTILYSALLGGGGVDTVTGMVLGPNSVLYLTGGTGSVNFPVTGNALQTGLPPAGMQCSFLTKLSAAQGLLYSTYFKSTQSSGYGAAAKAVAADTAGNAYITGQAGPGLPLGTVFYQPSLNGTSSTFVTQFLANNTLGYSTYVGQGGSGLAIAADSTGAAVVVGLDVNGAPLLTKVATDGRSLVFSSPLPGALYATSVALDGGNNIYVAGGPSGGPSPPTSWSIRKYSPQGSLSYSTTLNYFAPVALAADANGNLSLFGNVTEYSYNGSTYVPNTIPYITADAFQVTPGYGPASVFRCGGCGMRATTAAALLRLAPDGQTVLYGSYLAGNLNPQYGSSAFPFDIPSSVALDSAGNAYVTGFTTTADFPVTPGAYSYNQGSGNVFVAKFDYTVNNAPALAVSSNSVTINTYPGAYPAASVAVTVFGNNGFAVPFTAQASVPSLVQIQTNSSSTPANLTLTATPPDNSSSQLLAHVDVSAAGVRNGRQTVAVTVNVSPVSVVATPSPVPLFVPANSSGSAQVALSSSPGPAAFTIGAVASGCAAGVPSGQCPAWLIVSANQGVTPATLTVSAVTAHLAQGAYQGTFQVGVASIAPITISVTLTVTGQPSTPAIKSLYPFVGVGPSQTFSAVYNSAYGWPNLSLVYFMANVAQSPSNSCYVEYNAAANTMRLIGDDGVTWLGPLTPGSGILTNGACTLNGAASSASGSGNDLTVNYAITFQPSYAGRRSIFLSAIDHEGMTLDWSPYGAWWPTLPAGSLTNWYRLYDPFTGSHHFTTDSNEYNTLIARGFTGEGAIGQAYNAPNGSAQAFYRIYIIPARTHFWTTDRNEYLTLVLNRGYYSGEGIDPFLLPSAAGGALPYYRLLYCCASPPIHFWTTDANEYATLQQRGWNSEGISGYLMPVAKAQNASVNRPIGVVNGGSYGAGAIAAGQRILVYGQGLAQASVSIDGLAVKALRTTDTEMEIIAPEQVAGRRRATIRVAYADGTEDMREVEVAAASPAVYAADQYGKGQALVRTVGSTGGQGDIAAGDEVLIYATGLGKNLPISVTIGSYPAELVRITESEGKTELRIRVPEGLKGTGMAPVTVRAGEFVSQPGVTLAVR